MESKTHRGLPPVSARPVARVRMTRRGSFSTNHPRRYYFALVVKNQIMYLAMGDKSISDIEIVHRFLKDISTKYAAFSERERSGTCGPRVPLCVASCFVCARRGMLCTIPIVTHEHYHVSYPVKGSSNDTANRGSAATPTPALSSRTFYRTQW